MANRDQPTADASTKAHDQPADGRIARLAGEILDDHVQRGKGDVDPEEMVESRLDLDPNEAQGLVNAIQRIRDGKKAGGDAEVGGPARGSKTSTAMRDTVLLTIPTDQIVKDIITQARAVMVSRPSGTDPEAVKGYADRIRSGAKLPPILVGRRNPDDADDEHASYFLIDGWHRLEAMTEHLGMTEVDCEVTGEIDLDTCRWMAIERNRTNGVQYVQRDRLGVFRAYIEAGEHLERKGRFVVVKSARDISIDLGGFRISRQLVAKWALEHYPNVYEAMPGRVVQGVGSSAEKQEQAAKWAAERRAIAMKAAVSQVVAIYRDAPRSGAERKALAQMVKLLPWRMTKGRIKMSEQKAFEAQFDDPSAGPRPMPDEF